MVEKIIEHLSDFDYEKRMGALDTVSKLIKNGTITKYNQQFPYDNMHIHSFHSFNYKNWSPSRIILEAYRYGLKHTGIVDFDTLAALEETLTASKLIGVPSLGGLETRVYISQFADRVINSPGEPGIYYINGMGFRKVPQPGSEAEKIYKNLHKISERRNKKVVEKLNEFLSPVKIDYEKDVLPLTPSGNPTERHIIKAYIEKSESMSGNRFNVFWSEILKIPGEKIEQLKNEKIGDFMEKIRSVLVKNGGPGYVKPEPETFPQMADFVRMVKESGGIVVGNWLDGTNSGEENPEEFLEFMLSQGVKIMNIIPERNWNIENLEEKAKKVKKLDQFMDACKKMNVPVICGTEMNKFGQPFVDNFNAPELKKHIEWFEKSVLTVFDTELISSI